jgi:hypothetical protein
MREVDLRNAPFLIQALRRTQKLMDVDHYLAEYDLAPPAGGVVAGLSPTRTIADGSAVIRLARG